MKMSMFYSAQTGGFYAADIHGSDIPADAVEITASEHQALLRGQSEGRRIVPDESGRPMLIERLPPEPPGPPTVVTRAQGKAALIQAGLWGAVVAYVDAIEDPTEQALARVALDDTTHWQRSSPFLNAAAAALELSGEDLDALFLTASQIEL